MLCRPVLEGGQDQVVAGRVALVDRGQRGTCPAGDLTELDRVVPLGLQDLHDDVEVGGALPGIDALEGRHVRVVAAHPDADVLLVDLGVVGRVVVPPLAGPGLDPGVALAVDDARGSRAKVLCIPTNEERSIAEAVKERLKPR